MIPKRIDANYRSWPHNCNSSTGSNEVGLSYKHNTLSLESSPLSEISDLKGAGFPSMVMFPCPWPHYGDHMLGPIAPLTWNKEIGPIFNWVVKACESQRSGCPPAPKAGQTTGQMTAMTITSRPRPRRESCRQGPMGSRRAGAHYLGRSCAGLIITMEELNASHNLWMAREATHCSPTCGPGSPHPAPRALHLLLLSVGPSWNARGVLFLAWRWNSKHGDTDLVTSDIEFWNVTT